MKKKEILYLSLIAIICLFALSVLILEHKKVIPINISYSNDTRASNTYREDSIEIKLENSFHDTIQVFIQWQTVVNGELVWKERGAFWSNETDDLDSLLIPGPHNIRDTFLFQSKERLLLRVKKYADPIKNNIALNLGIIGIDQMIYQQNDKNSNSYDLIVKIHGFFPEEDSEEIHIIGHVCQPKPNDPPGSCG